MEFEWDEDKAAANRQKHEVSFAEAQTVFADRLAVIFDDPQHSARETREIVIGYSETGRLLLVSFTERGENMRLISARAATSQERKNHENNAN